MSANSSRIKLTIDVFDETDQLASVRSGLLVRDLSAEIQREFDLDPGDYILYLKDQGVPLDPDKSLVDLGVGEGDALVFARRQTRRIPPGARLVAGTRQAALREAQTGRVFEILWTPAVIGRPYAHNRASADTLAVALGDDFAEARSVSRGQHAQLIEQDGAYYLESLKANNLSSVNGATVEIGQRRALAPGDRIQVGKISLVFEPRGG
ncbi:MAG: FHA domain-containing protein [Anaerolineae bacterium]|nr:FHA domain-containing protein [Anaerolineae bacterium]